MRLSELDSFVTKFKRLWVTGQEAHLNFNSHGGQAWITLSVGLGSPPPTSPPSSPPPQHCPPCSSRNGPSEAAAVQDDRLPVKLLLLKML